MQSCIACRIDNGNFFPVDEPRQRPLHFHVFAKFPAIRNIMLLYVNRYNSISTATANRKEKLHYFSCHSVHRHSCSLRSNLDTKHNFSIYEILAIALKTSSHLTRKKTLFEGLKFDTQMTIFFTFHKKDVNKFLHP